MDWIDYKQAATLLGMHKAGFYRMVNRMKRARRMSGGEAVWVVQCWGGIQYPGQRWKFRESCIRTWLDEQFRAK